jgi:protocatechuate 3,4-dioxygenase beta subunit
MKNLILVFLTTTLLHTAACTQPNQKVEKRVVPNCEDCELMFEGMPQNLSWQTTISGSNEPGEPLIISGIIYKQDGKTPAPGVVLYVYHTDNSGHYSPRLNQKLGKRHGRLRGWMKTDTQGRYQFTTIRPASYPNRKDPQHIHPVIKESETSIYWIDEYLFDDDQFVTAEVKSREHKRGGPGIIHLKKNENGVWTGQRDIILGMNIPNY